MSPTPKVEAERILRTICKDWGLTAEAKQKFVSAVAVLLAEDRVRLARMIEHHPDRWWSSGEIAEAVRRGERCHPECPECFIE